MKVVGIGETIIDILFKNNQPISANPGGSTFNTFISLGRMGVNGLFISEVGNDHFGQLTRDFLRSNGLTDEYMHNYSNGKTPVAIAFLNEQNDAEYSFYKDMPEKPMTLHYPQLEANDVLIFGSYFSLNKQFRERILTLTEAARQSGAIVYYDPNFRPSHLKELPELRETLFQNFAAADIVRGSDEDFSYIFGENNLDVIYEKMKDYCPNLICTRGAKGVELFTPNFRKHYDAPQLKAISTVGAGDNFNAGFIYGLNKCDISKKLLPLLSQNEWDELIRCAMAFSSEVCCSIENYVSQDFARSFK